jgi:hypothetical protein
VDPLSFREWVAQRVGQHAQVDHEHWATGSAVNEGDLAPLHEGTLPDALDTSDRYQSHVYVVVGDTQIRAEWVHSIETPGGRIVCCVERSEFKLNYDNPARAVRHDDRPCPIHDEPSWRWP